MLIDDIPQALVMSGRVDLVVAPWPCIHKSDACTMLLVASCFTRVQHICKTAAEITDHCTLMPAPVSSGFGFLQKPRSTSADRNMVDTIEKPNP
eukprot:COSAG02_NODE_510_length_20863_cov_139.455233_2_plen_94_part_00